MQTSASRMTAPSAQPFSTSIGSANTTLTRGEYKARPAHQDDIEAIAVSMRPADRREIKLLSGQEPKQALTECFEKSDVCRTLLYQDTPLIMYGTSRFDDETGIVWGLGSDEIDKHTMPFLRVSRAEVELLQGDYDLIFNFVHTENTLHLKWVEFVDFDVFDPIEHPSGQMVRPIQRRK